MCGIVAYVGERDAVPIVFGGLRQLEYRGYDSAGIAVIQGGQIARRRCAGKLDKLEGVLATSPVVGRMAIGHTRWATHGKPSEMNAHPHVDCHGETVVVHNGIVENYLALRHQLTEEGHTFASETDTEVIAHLVESRCDRGDDLTTAVGKALLEAKGAHAVVVMSAKEPGKLVAARVGNAGGVVVGLGDGEVFVASDLPAILSHTRQVVFLDDQEMATITRERVSYARLDGTPVSKTSQRVGWDPIAAAKGGYRHFMLKEIHEQARAITDTLRGRLQLQSRQIFLEDVQLTQEEIARLDRVVIVACGTAWHAALVGRFLMEQWVGLPVQVDYGSEFRYRKTPLDDRTLLVAVSQSGETADTLVSMEEARSRGAQVVAITNTVGSQASRLAHSVIYTHAGPEIGVAATKTFVVQLVALHLLNLFLASARGTLGAEALVEEMEHLSALPHLAGQTLARERHCEEIAGRYFKCRDFLYLGRGINYPIALEGALKLKEIAYVHAEGYPAGEMKHGPIALIDEEMPVVAIAPQDSVRDKMVSNMEQVKTRGGIVIALASDGDEAVAQSADHVLYVPRTVPHLMPVLTVIPLQLLAYHIAVRRGCDVDQPRNLAKSVTVE